MLELRPNCENCGKLLPPESSEAMICSFECTFCFHCYESFLENVCPNCGGGFSQRPIRPKNNWKNNNNLSEYPASTKTVYRPLDPAEHSLFAKGISKIPAKQR
ncbi:DUF1272 domain-containing protein [Leptospira ilyithenensis]|uniref:DUF1272 domain-containing protein n=2 Tax=Leptospira ilyithenensis TaxID=2484901 RepID=A0A4R9LP67_9LEPT|nr:DUF1272 domain-containing protein [Leptospira ilyithenensis]